MYLSENSDDLNLYFIARFEFCTKFVGSITSVLVGLFQGYIVDNSYCYFMTYFCLLFLNTVSAVKQCPITHSAEA